MYKRTTSFDNGTASRFAAKEKTRVSRALQVSTRDNVFGRKYLKNVLMINQAVKHENFVKEKTDKKHVWIPL